MIEKPTVVGQPGSLTLGKDSAIGGRRGSRRLVSLIILAAVLLIVVLVAVAGNIEKWLWMRQLDYVVIFWGLLSVRWTMFCSAFVFAFLYLWVNFRQAIRNSAAFGGDGSAGRPTLFAGTSVAGQAGIDVPPNF